ncbi:MAG: hypothetical protein BGO54_16620 [Sphingobacteriales bacterium 46-32]|nr:MAG: hypothetical protein BGO54_16620 [Sphingobacteriales bacterium 46-32]
MGFRYVVFHDKGRDAVVDNRAHFLSVDLTPKSNMKENQRDIVENSGGYLLVCFSFRTIVYQMLVYSTTGISLFLISF